MHPTLKNHKFWSKICSTFKSKPSFDTVFDTDYHVEEIDTQQKQFDFRRDTNSTACFKPWAKNYSNPIDFNETRPSLGEFWGVLGVLGSFYCNKWVKFNE